MAWFSLQTVFELSELMTEQLGTPKPSQILGQLILIDRGQCFFVCVCTHQLQ